MCGIAGVALRPGATLPGETVRALDAALAYRCPDGAGTHVAASAVLVANGEIYNHVELRREALRDVNFAIGSDCESPLHLYRREGLAFARALCGMHVIAIGDRVARRVVVEITVMEAEFWQHLPAIAAAMGDPTADYAIVPTWLLARRARGGGGCAVGRGRGRDVRRLWPLPVGDAGLVARRQGDARVRHARAAWASSRPGAGLARRGWKRPRPRLPCPAASG
jgi:hypothetical protein